MTITTSRQRIITYLGQHKGSTALEISRALSVTSANVRYHLSILMGDGRVQCLGSRPEQGRGRPFQVFALSEAAVGNNLAGLVEVLFSIVRKDCPENELDVILKMIAERLIPTQPERQVGHITHRLTQVITLLNRYGYVARWEAHAQAPRVIFEHCPYAAVISKHPEMCRVDGMILNQHLDIEVEQNACLEQTSRGTSYCQFLVKPKK
ncbi:MAG: helix-turn-helix domain-containing protein [Chloroflexota bacterium]